MLKLKKAGSGTIQIVQIQHVSSVITNQTTDLEHNNAVTVPSNKHGSKRFAGTGKPVIGD